DVINYCKTLANMKLFLLCLLVVAAADAECEWGQRECGDAEGSCIYYRYWCDGVVDPDCTGGEDETDCSSCDEGFIHCESTDICIPQPWFCDGHVDCPGQEDESMCSTPAPGECNEGYFQCRNGQCIHPKFRCDGTHDCLNGFSAEDEQGCTECQTGFHCIEDTCINSDSLCDSFEDCKQGEDETEAVAGCECLPGEFMCSNGDCIPSNWRCNGWLDCYEGSDEIDCDVTTLASRAGGPRMTGPQSHFINKIKKVKEVSRNNRGKRIMN
ncbi:unnamed protein product, partial [Meganyctiphanes norvegica]